MSKKQKKYIFITGGVLSSLGKGLTAACIGALMENRGLKITFLKLDPYINVDPGTMSPFQHGEVFVTDDGTETDLDLGHYERYTSTKMGKSNNSTTGKIYYSVIEKERRGEYLGKTIQVIPHITNEIKSVIHNAITDEDVIIIEIGGTVGDIEGLPFFETIRQLKLELGAQNTLCIHLTYVPYIPTSGEVKTKPTQHSVKQLREIGIQPDILICRTDRILESDIKEKIALFCNVAKSAVITAHDVDCIYEVPLILHKEGLDDKIAELLNIWSRAPGLSQWKKVVKRIQTPKVEVTIGIVGKYVELTESYKSLNEALVHGGIANNSKVNLAYINSDDLTKNDSDKLLNEVDGILVPGGFGERGTEGKVEAIQYARENKIPFFGICLGMQMAVIEFARNVCKFNKANSSEFDPDTKYPVVHLLPEQVGITDKGATMRLGSYPCTVVENSFAFKAYSSTEINERHRHRYEYNNDFRKEMEEKGLLISGTSPDGYLVEIVELQDHPWFLGCQFHPEFKSKPLFPHPLFKDFIAAAVKKTKSK